MNDLQFFPPLPNPENYEVTDVDYGSGYASITPTDVANIAQVASGLSFDETSLSPDKFIHATVASGIVGIKGHLIGTQDSPKEFQKQEFTNGQPTIRK